MLILQFNCRRATLIYNLQSSEALMSLIIFLPCISGSYQVSLFKSSFIYLGNRWSVWAMDFVRMLCMWQWMVQHVYFPVLPFLQLQWSVLFDPGHFVYCAESTSAILSRDLFLCLRVAIFVVILEVACRWHDVICGDGRHVSSAVWGRQNSASPELDTTYRRRGTSADVVKDWRRRGASCGQELAAFENFWHFTNPRTVTEVVLFCDVFQPSCSGISAWSLALLLVVDIVLRGFNLPQWKVKMWMWSCRDFFSDDGTFSGDSLTRLFCCWLSSVMCHEYSATSLCH